MEHLSPEQQELLKKRLDRIVSAGAKMRIAQNDYRKSHGPITREKAQRAETDFDRLIKEEVKQGQSQQSNILRWKAQKSNGRITPSTPGGDA